MYESPYDNENSFGLTYGEHREALELGWEAYLELQRYRRRSASRSSRPPSTSRAADLLAKLDVPAYKIASGDLTNLPLICHVAAFGKPVIVSTGGASTDDVQRTYDAVMAINPQLCLMQCTASYPAERKT